jgi:hypothetical protein
MLSTHLYSTLLKFSIKSSPLVIYIIYSSPGTAEQAHIDHLEHTTFKN